MRNEKNETLIFCLTRSSVFSSLFHFVIPALALMSSLDEMSISLHWEIFIERSMGDYHSIALNLVVLVTYMQVGAQEVCWCQGTSPNKDALVPLSSGYTNWTLTAAPAEHTCGGCISTILVNSEFPPIHRLP